MPLGEEFGGKLPSSQHLCSQSAKKQTKKERYQFKCFIFIQENMLCAE
jgi:hypothetical protein